jgi:hypothetical protein
LFLRHANWRGACHQRPVPRTSRLGASSATVFFRTIAGATLAVALAAAIELFLILLLPCVAAPVLAAAAGELLPILVISLGIAWLAADARFLARLVFGIPVHRRTPQHLLFEPKAQRLDLARSSCLWWELRPGYACERPRNTRGAGPHEPKRLEIAM